MLARKLTDHAKTAARVIAKHLMRRTITEIEVIPEHDERNASDEYRTNRHRLIEADQVPCWMCGTRENLECHHWFEWSEWNAEDAKDASAALLKLDFHGYGHTVRNAPISGPDAIANLCVLCRRDHRERGFGIHNTTGPVWWARWAKKNGVRVVHPVSE